jgi:phosphohistidine swiveling domain-containing protein
MTSKPFSFGTKAETLARLSGVLRSATVLPLYSFNVELWRRNRRDILSQILDQDWGASTLVVRSSCCTEDKPGYASAGRFLTRLDVKGRQQLQEAVDSVILSFCDSSPDNQVLVQPQLLSSLASGVATTRDPCGGGPYRVVNWIDGEDTTAVTAGKPGIKRWYCLTYARPCPPVSYLARVLDLLSELENLVPADAFEIEFGVAQDEKVVLFQVRPLPCPVSSITLRHHKSALASCARQLRSLMQIRPPALGSESAFGIMPDWNPAEMIGVRPRRLALSLYRELITDQVWADARQRYGYRDLRGVPLLVDLCGLPYIDVRASFTSFVPAGVDHPVATRLVESYVSKLRSRPDLHDKVESEISLSSYHFHTPLRASSLVAEGILSRPQASGLVLALHDVTTRIVGNRGPVQRDLELVGRLARRKLATVGPPNDPIHRLRALMRLCTRHGTLPFSGLARAAFVAVDLVRSLVEEGVMTDEEGGRLIGSSNQVTAMLRQDFGTLSKDRFLEKYGFLRPGTYDIMSPRYDEFPDRYFDWSVHAVPDTPEIGFALRRAQSHAIRRLLEEHDMRCDTRRLLDFIRTSVRAREYAKLQFSRVISELLVVVRQVGEWVGFGAEDLSHVPINVLMNLPADARHTKKLLREAVELGKERHALAASICAPAVLFGPTELTSFSQRCDEPTFITQGRVVAPVADVTAGDMLDGAIAMITSADPGYDWIFTHRVVGLITAFGGANSHMAVRALELGLPAVIGAGEARFRRWLTADSLELDAASRLVRPIVGMRRAVPGNRGDAPSDCCGTPQSLGGLRQ